MQLSPETIRKAKEELREDESVKKHSLQLFREWLKVHPFIKNCCVDDIFLLSFLRVKKYLLNESFKVLENYLLFRYKNKQWFDLSDEKLNRYRELTKDGFMYNCEERNLNKSSYIICNLAQVDVDKYSVNEIFHCYFINSMLFLLDEKTQICGSSGSVNGIDATIRQVAIYPVGQVIDFAKYLVNSNPLRFISMDLVHTPSYATQIINIFKMTLSEKVRNRVHLLKTFDDLQKIVDKKCLPKKMGGILDEQEMIDRHLKNFEEKLPMLRKISDFELIESNIDEKIKSEFVGSFRKLDID